MWLLSDFKMTKIMSWNETRQYILTWINPSNKCLVYLDYMSIVWIIRVLVVNLKLYLKDDEPTQ